MLVLYIGVKAGRGQFDEYVMMGSTLCVSSPPGQALRAAGKGQRVMGFKHELLFILAIIYALHVLVSYIHILYHKQGPSVVFTIIITKYVQSF